MAKVAINEGTLSAIAGAIRGKNGTTTTYKPGEMATAISNLPQTLDVTAPAVGFVPTAWDEEGKFSAGIWYGTTIPRAYFDRTSSISIYARHVLSYIQLPEDLETISGYAFKQCTLLALTELPESVTTIGSYAFQNCYKLGLTKLPDGITSIENYTFADCDVLALTELPGGVTTIGNYAFRNCTDLTSLTFKGTPTTISSTAFNGCSNLTTINVPWAEGEVANAPWGATNATINYNYVG